MPGRPVVKTFAHMCSHHAVTCTVSDPCVAILNSTHAEVRLQANAAQSPGVRIFCALRINT